ncbi:unnamed protein product [Chondrus crispus]|uniref:3'-phosphate/5'-hydroxy nucleic acid ligase n=1 Tax=Chondrus crispus TaxID=2769 RepID=R7QGJ5_CHOCR|nr:unnamed protein product [Chondrus crispus]CDF36883.1 unnamed protein product [Chondrus crispus]|eukprot:XP_005716702.1 unnamed protein product [Chondrus crispus]
MGVTTVGQVVAMIHSGSRGLAHQVATDALQHMEKAMARDGIEVNDRQLACARIESNHFAEMAAAANLAWVNRSLMTFLAGQAFAKLFRKSPAEQNIHVIYDVSHNIAKVETINVYGKVRKLLVHRKRPTRAFPPHHRLVPYDYQMMG